MADPDSQEDLAERRRLRTIGIAVIGAGAWLILWPRMNGPAMLGPLPSHYWGWMLLAIGWAVLFRAIRSRNP